MREAAHKEALAASAESEVVASELAEVKDRYAVIVGRMQPHLAELSEAQQIPKTRVYSA